MPAVVQETVPHAFAKDFLASGQIVGASVSGFAIRGPLEVCSFCVPPASLRIRATAPVAGLVHA